MDIRKFSFSLSFLIFFTIPLYAQTTNNSDKVDEKKADVSITAKVEAKELKFEVVPNPKVDFPGTTGRKTEWSSERKNLPESVEPNVIYRDIGIKLKIVSVFDDIDKIVDEALGIKPQTETPTTEKPAQTVEDKSVKTAPAPTEDKAQTTAEKPKN